MRKTSIFIFAIIIIFICQFCMLKETKTNVKDDKPIRPEYKQERVLQFCYFINKTEKEYLDYLATTITTLIKENIFVIKKIRIPAEFQIITNKDEILKNKEKMNNTSSAKIQQVFSRTKNDFYGENKGYLKEEAAKLEETTTKTKKEDENKDKNKEKEKSAQEEQKEAQDAADADPDAANKDAGGDKKLTLEEEILLSQSKLSSKEYTDKEIINMTEDIEPELEPILGIDVKDYAAIDKVTVDLTVSDTFLEVFVEDLDKITEVDKAIGKGQADIYVIGTYEMENEDDMIFKVKGYDKDKKKFVFNFIIKTKLETLSKGASKEAKRIALEVISNIVNIPAGELVIESDIANSIVYIDDNYAGSTEALDSTEKKSQLVLNYIPYGYHKIEVIKQGYEKKKNEIYLKENEINYIKLSMTKISEDGIIEVKSNPSGADVWLDLDYKGVTPVKLKNLRPTVHRIRVRKEGFNEKNFSVDTKKSRNQKVNVALETEEADHFDYVAKSRNLKRTRTIFTYSTIGLLPLTIASYYIYSIDEDKKVRFEKGTAPSTEDEDAWNRQKGFYTSVGVSEENRRRDKKIGRSENMKNVISILNGSCLILSLTFLWLELDSHDLEIGLVPSPSLMDSAYGGSIYMAYRY